LSPSAGFTGGSTTTDPIALDSILLSQGGLSHISFGSVGTNSQYQLHVEMSNDGQCTRMWVFEGGSFQAMWICDRLKNSVAGWSTPWVFDTEYLTPAINTVWNNVSPTYSGVTYVAQGVTVYQLLNFYWTCEGINGNNVPQTYNSTNDLNSEWPMCPLGLYQAPGGTDGTPWAGRYGMFYDLWFGCAGAISTPPYQFYAGAIAHNYVQIGAYILPWSGAATMNTT
jgi:hypothetical protein